MKRYLTNEFTTFALDNSRNIFASHIYVATNSEKSIIANELFEFINDVYDEVGGFKSFKDIHHFITDSYLWYITYDGPQPESLEDFDISKVYVVSIFRNKNGLKLVGLARRIVHNSERNKEQNMILRRNANSALIEHIKFIADRGWAEVSGKIEKYFYQTLGLTYIVDPYILQEHKIFRNIDVDIDEFHYYRPLRTGEEPVRKIAFGTIKI